MTNNKIIEIYEKYISTYKEQVKNAKDILEMGNNQLSIAKLNSDYESIKIFTKLIAEARAIKYEYEEGFIYWVQRLNNYVKKNGIKNTYK